MHSTTFHQILLLLLLLPAGAWAQGIEYFLEIPNIDGESTTVGYEDQICVSSFSWGVETDAAGVGGSRPVPQIFKVSKALDQATPELFFACVSSPSISEVTLSIVSDGASGQPHLKAEYILRNVLVRSFEPGGDTTAPPREVIGLEAEEVQINYYDARGQLTMRRLWNFSTNTGR